MRDAANRLSRTVIVLCDVTGRQRGAEERLRLEEQLVQAKIREAGTLAGGIAHDFNNIPAPILG